jgi:hypothetical protein
LTPLLSLFSPLNALVTLVIAIVTVVVALTQTRKLRIERLDQTIEEYDKINRALREQDEQRVKTLGDKEDKILRLTLRIGQIEGQNRWLIAQNLLLEQYCQQMVALARKGGLDVPPRPTVDQEGG